MPRREFAALFGADFEHSAYMDLLAGFAGFGSNLRPFADSGDIPGFGID